MVIVGRAAPEKPQCSTSWEAWIQLPAARSGWMAEMWQNTTASSSLLTGETTSVCVPVLQSGSEPDGARECGAGDADLQESAGCQGGSGGGGAEGRLNNFPAQLSGGEQQRVSIARALAKNPKLLLCDEPTGALDYQTGKAILKLLQDMCRQRGMTVIVITHNSALTPMADRVIKIKNGKVSRMTQNETPTPVEDRVVGESDESNTGKIFLWKFAK